MKIGVLIPTRGDRPRFIAHAKKMLLRQTRLPDFIEIVDDEAEDKSKIDITWRYRIGCERLFAKGADVVICWEDDDWYHRRYIELMVSGWWKAGKPTMFGINKTLYYNIHTQKYLEIPTGNRASMMSTLLGRDIFKLEWPGDNEPYLDWQLWRQRNGTVSEVRATWLAVGIKHGTGLCGGAGHDPNWKRYNGHDNNYEMLRKIIGRDAEFYIEEVMRSRLKIDVSLQVGIPFVSFITRKYKRPNGLRKNVASLMAQKGDVGFEQITIEDPVGYGLHAANASFSLVRHMIRGKWVHLLDDDDFLVNPNFVKRIKEIDEKHSPDVIVFRMIIKTGSWDNYYPSPVCWEQKKPILAHIGGSCFVIRDKLFRKFISHFNQPRCGDFYFINALYQSGAKFYWHDELMAETGKVGKGQPETA